MNRVALTFDDGPNGQYTLDILNILEHNNTKACFFLLAKNIEHSPEIALRIKEEGHLIGNHTYNHPHLNTLSIQEILWQIEEAEAVFNRILNIKPQFFRPPYGEYNGVVEKIIQEKGYRLVLWDMDCHSMDWRNPVPELITEVATSNAKDGSIILLHDGRNIRMGEPRENTVAALPEIIRIFKEKNFDILRLDELWKE